MTAPRMTAAERVLWRIACQAALAAARAPGVDARARELKKALAGSGDWRMPDQRSLPRACFYAFWTVAKAWAIEPDAALRAALAGRLEALADAAGDMLDGLHVPPPPPTGDAARPARGWPDRADLA